MSGRGEWEGGKRVSENGVSGRALSPPFPSTSPPHLPVTLKATILPPSLIPIPPEPGAPGVVEFGGGRGIPVVPTTQRTPHLGGGRVVCKGMRKRR